jgi:hypothetical protein
MSGSPTTPATFDAFLSRLFASGIATPEAVRGCTEDEIRHLEESQGVRLPESFRRYLATLGHRRGDFAHDIDMDYTYLLTCRERVRENWEVSLRELYFDNMEADAEFADDDEDDPDFATVRAAYTGYYLPDHLPARAVFCFGRYGDWYGFVVCDRDDDSPVYVFGPDADTEEANRPRLVYNSFPEMLHAWLDEALAMRERRAARST